jgi:hypothetical protein
MMQGASGCGMLTLSVSSTRKKDAATSVVTAKDIREKHVISCNYPLAITFQD